MDARVLSIDTVREWCVARNIRHMVQQETGHLLLWRGEDAPPARVIARPERGMVTFAVPMAFQVPAERHAEIARACTLANSSSFMGAWVLNTQNGDLYFRITTLARGVHYEADGLGLLIQVLIGTADGLAAAFRAVALEGAGYEAVLEAQRAAAAPSA